MAKGYLEELAEWVKQDTASRSRQDQARVAFLAVRAEVQAALAAGYALKTIWAHLHATGRIPYRYETFLKHVRRELKQAPAEMDPGQGAAHGPKGEAATPPTVEGFTFDATPKKEDLI